jgi:heparanase
MNNTNCIFVGAFVAILATATSLPVKSQTVPLKLDLKKMPAVGKVDERFQSYNVEMLEVTGGRFWAPYKQQTGAPADTLQATPGGMPASLYRYRAPINLADPRLRKLAAALGPAYMRVSGTWANSTYFHDSPDPAPEKPPAGFNGILTRDQWRGVIDFTNAVDAKLVSSFAVSQGVRNADGVWTPVEAEKILNYTKSVGGSIVAAEMFNEPTFASVGGVPKGYDAAAYGRDFHAFATYIKKADPQMEILGPGSIGEPGALGNMPGMHLLRTEDMLKDEGPGLDAFSYHFYGGLSKRCAMMGAAALGTTPEAALTDDWLSRTNRDEAYYAALRDKYLPGKPLWLTETGETACGGDPWASDFIDSFRYLNQLGTLAKHGVQVVIHNTLAASDYALIDETTLTPRPNYWSAVLWRRLMGTTVLDAGDAPRQQGLYLYAHCLRDHPGGSAILAINSDKTTSREIALPAAYTQYTLTASNLMDSSVMLNGVELKLTPSGDLPSLDGIQHKAGKITLSPTSITFFAIPEAHNQSCR